MTAAFIAQSVVFLACIYLLVRRAERRDSEHVRERAELINHIQFGERLPSSMPEWEPRPPREPDESHLVGTIDHSG